MASGFTEEIVKDFIIKNGCKVTNHELVTKFKTFLNDQEYKGMKGCSRFSAMSVNWARLNNLHLTLAK